MKPEDLPEPADGTHVVVVLHSGESWVLRRDDKLAEEAWRGECRWIDIVNGEAFYWGVVTASAVEVSVAVSMAKLGEEE